MIKLDEIKIPDTYLSAPVFGSNVMIDIEKMKEKYKDRLKVERRKTLKLLNTVPQCEIKRLENNIVNRNDMKRYIDDGEDNKEDIGDKQNKKRLIFEEKKKLLDIKRQQIGENGMEEHSKFGIHLKSRAISVTNFKPKQKSKSNDDVTRSNTLKANNSKRSIHNFLNPYSSKKEDFSTILNLIINEENLLEKFIVFINKNQHIDIPFDSNQITYLFNLWQELYIFSMLKDTTYKNIQACEIYKEYLSDLDKLKDMVPIFKPRNLHAIIKDLEASYIKRSNICLENFNAIRHDIENELSYTVSLFEKEECILRDLNNKTTILNFVEEKEEKTMSSTEKLVNQIHMNKTFISETLAITILFNFNNINHNDLITDLFKIYNQAEDKINSASVRASVVFLVYRWIFLCGSFWKANQSLKDHLLLVTSNTDLKLYWNLIFSKLNSNQLTNQKSIEKIPIKKKSWDMKFNDFKMLNLNSEKISDIADQITLINVESFLLIESYEIAKWNFESRDNKAKLVNISRFVKNMNTLSERVFQIISSRLNSRDKLKSFECFVLLAQKLLQLGNFNAFFVLQGSFSSFEKIVGNLSPKIQEILREFSALMSPQNNFKNYRERVKYLISQGKSLIPVLPIHLKDIYYIFERVNKNTENLLMEAEMSNSLREFITLITNMQSKWANTKMNHIPNLQILLELKLGESN